MIAADNLIRQTVSRFPDYAERKIEIVPVEKGGSDRRYYRVRVTNEHSLILVKYGDGREENRHYVTIARFLKSLDVKVPEIFFHDEEEGLIWMEDLGERDLCSHQHDPWEKRRALYGAALDELVKLHTTGHKAQERTSLALQPEFDEHLYVWEQEYFIENCLGRCFGVEQEIDRQPLREVARALAERPRVLIHRDFQSQNIMTPPDQQGSAFMIDFQGLRPGLEHYDLASLIYDPYVTLTETERETLIDDYLQRMSKAGSSVANDRFTKTFALCATQRLMQALGAYGYLGLVKNRPSFLDHIPKALDALRAILAGVSPLHDLTKMIETLPPFKIAPLTPG